MSTKIFNGYVINGNMSAYSLMNLMGKISKDCQAICDDLYHTEVAKFASLCLDTKLIFGEEEMNRIISFKYKYVPSKFADNLFSYIEELLEQHTKSTNSLQDFFDFKCELKLMPIKNKTLFTLYTEKKEYKSLFGDIDDNDKECVSIKYPQIAPYPYYDNTDNPETLTLEEWHNRGEEWDNAFRNNENGFIYSMAKAPFFYEENILTQKIEIMYEERLHKLAFGKIKNDFNKVNKNLLNTNDISKYLDIFNSYIQTEEYKIDLNKVKEDIKAILPKTYTKKDFNMIELKPIN